MAPKSPMLAALLVLRVCLGAAFLYLGGEKLFRLEDFTRDVANYQIVVAPWDAVVAYLVPWLEIVAGFLAMVGWLRKGALITLAILTVGFIGGISQAWARGLEISCGCFGTSDSPTNYPLHLVLNGVILGVIVLLLCERCFAPRHLFGGRKLRLP